MWFFKTPGGIWTAVIAFIALCAGGWFLWWHLALSSVNNQYRVNTHNQEYQGAQVDNARNQYQGWLSVPPGSPQATEIKREFCAVYAGLTQPPADLASDAAQLSCP